MGKQAKSEGLFYYFKLEETVHQPGGSASRGLPLFMPKRTLGACRTTVFTCALEGLRTHPVAIPRPGRMVPLSVGAQSSYHLRCLGGVIRDFPDEVFLPHTSNKGAKYNGKSNTQKVLGGAFQD